MCKRAAITHVYLYFGDFDPDIELEYVEKLAEFVKQSHQKGLKIEGLTGNPTWSLKEFHDDCVKWIDSFLRVVHVVLWVLFLVLATLQMFQNTKDYTPLVDINNYP